MPVFVFFIVLSLAFYLFYKIQYVRSNRPMERKWLSAKSSMMLGLFVGLFGINTFFVQQSTVAYAIATIFIVLGFSSVWAGFKAYRHFTPYVKQEAAEWDKSS
ncbi:MULTISPECIES: YtpI family protein [Bacillus]|uniref:YtpI-like protein n=1 Tax=Bacillus smithii 7_3_47FAA TaxID=665952 RepID=G9QQG1_9BACI|nr:YtpI family protein [Bacillus smithii]AKP48103.1 putative Membrane Spanning Protein [Bacillus smithii]EHL73024.1 hypothetical protein HMPREF1015_00528 [Bacillus smithii 7_3_47FAA]MED0658897.1 YtpI family protein [Bacillus smithii]MED1418546.1 YtpI family protein [Bacillus smithii]MED1455885.1 YtpI family protein [Bacillus smithii]